jgi:hypothetical protein
MLTPELESNYPNLLSDGGKKKSEKAPKYNCVAWAAKWDKEQWWQPDTFEPGMYWPKGILDDGSLLCFIRLFESLGYKKVESKNLEADCKLDVFYEKVIIYENRLGHFTHVARQKYSGTWWSKLGEDEDVYHDTPWGLECQSYGKPLHLMRRPCSAPGILLRAFFKLFSS